MPKRVINKNNSVETSCGNCKCLFRVLTLRFNDRRKNNPNCLFYCSPECYNVVRSKKVSEAKKKAALKKGSRLQLNCYTCNTQFTRIKSDCKENNFCSPKCWSVYDGILKSSKPLPDVYQKWIKDVSLPGNLEEECWIWKGTLDTWDNEYRHKNGRYGVFVWPGHNGDPNRGAICAHIASYKLFSGDYNTKGFHICHTCDNPPCVNPFHLFKGTSRDNQQDCISKGRRPMGPQAFRAKFSEYQVKEIRDMHSSRKYTAKQLGYIFGVNISTIQRLLRGESYRNVP